MLIHLIGNIKNLFTKQRLLSTLLVLNIVISCLVICFSYGLYQNYNVIVHDGESDQMLHLDVEIKPELLSTDPDKPFTCEVTLQNMYDFINSLSDETIDNVRYVTFNVGYENNVYVHENEKSGYYTQPAYLTRSEEGLTDGEEWDYIDDRYFVNGDKVALVGEELFQGHNSMGVYSWGIACLASPGGSNYSVEANENTFLPDNCDEIEIEGEKYKIVATLQNSDMIYIPCTSLDPSTKLSSHYIIIYFKNGMTLDQYKDICSGLKTGMGDMINIPEVELTEASQIYYYKTIMLISVVIAVLAAINMAILYRYILEKRSSQLAIFRICGCSKGKAIMSYLLECLCINAPLFAITQLVYHKLIMPRLTSLFPNMAGAYSFKLYAAIFGLYIAASTLVMLIMIIHTVRSHSLVALKSAGKSTGKAGGIMKVFEVIQLSAVLTMIILIVSAIISRYSLYTPFEQYLTQKGYMVFADNSTLYYDEFAQDLDGCELAANEYSFILGNGQDIHGIVYSDEFAYAYKPMLSQGQWFDEAGLTYENCGKIPIVISQCGYKPGDIISTDFADYIVIGVVENKTNIASYWTDKNECKSIFDLYGVYDKDFDTRDIALMREADCYAKFGTHDLVWGTQFVFCDSDEEYADADQALRDMQLTHTPLSQVRKNSMQYIYEQMYTLFPIAVCIFILTIISTVSISAIYTKRQLRNYAIFYICGARWRTCALRSLKSSAITCGIAAAISAIVLIVGKLTLLKETVISFGWWHFGVCAGVIILYLALSMIMPLAIIGSNEPKEVLKEE